MQLIAFICFVILNFVKAASSCVTLIPLFVPSDNGDEVGMGKTKRFY